MAIGTAALLAGLGGAALSAGKHFAMDVPNARRQNKLAAETIRNSPWTGLTPNKVEQPNLFGTLFQGTTGGLALGQGIENNMSNLKFQDAVKSSLNTGKEIGNISASGWGNLLPKQGVGLGKMFNPQEKFSFSPVDRNAKFSLFG